MTLPSAPSSSIWPKKSGSSAFTFCRSASFASLSAGLSDTARLTPIRRFSRLPRWSSTCAASTRASSIVCWIAAAWSLRHWLQRPAPIKMMNGTTAATTSANNRDRMLRSTACPRHLDGPSAVAAQAADLQTCRSKCAQNTFAAVAAGPPTTVFFAYDERSLNSLPGRSPRFYLLSEAEQHRVDLQLGQGRTGSLPRHDADGVVLLAAAFIEREFRIEIV